MQAKLKKNNRKLKTAMTYYIKTSDPTRLNNVKKLIDEREQLFIEYKNSLLMQKDVDTTK